MHLHQDLTAQQALARGGRLVLLEEERGEQKAGIGRARGVHRAQGELREAGQRGAAPSVRTAAHSPTWDPAGDRHL